jgi:uncharacterized protein (DUF58 family)
MTVSVSATIGARFSIRRVLRDWFIERIRRRRGTTGFPFKFEYRHIYVVPTSFGLGFGTLLVFMALGGLNFNNNMALLVVFLLASIGQLTTLLAYRNLVGVIINSIRAEPVFGGDTAVFRLYLNNEEDRHRFAVQSGLVKFEDCVDIPAHSNAVLNLRLKTGRRGWMELPPFKLETRFPIGLFRAWSWVIPKSRCLVYPVPARKPPPLPQTGQGEAGLAQIGDGDQVHGLRKYRPGDSLRHIAWRASARHDQLFSLEMETPQQQACEIAWGLLSGVDTELRLSILTAWVLNAERKQIPYSLVLPGSSVGVSLGADHCAQCLELLALYGL